MHETKRGNFYRNMKLHKEHEGCPQSASGGSLTIRRASCGQPLAMANLIDKTMKGL